MAIYKNKSFDFIGHFSEGFAKIRLNLRYGYIDIDGNIVIQPIFEAAYDFILGRASIAFDGGWGYIDKNGDYTVSPKYVHTYNYSIINGLGCIQIDETPHLILIDINGNQITPLRFTFLEKNITNGAIIVANKIQCQIDINGFIE